MGVLDILAKLGILRYGATKAVYTDARDRPAELQMEGVYDAERDLVGGAPKRKPAPAKPQKPR
jgi:hypothetical protein